MRQFLLAAALAAAATVSACDRQADASSGATAPQAVSPADEIRTEFAQQNFGRAAELAGRAVAGRPNDPELLLLLAKTESRLGNAGDAVRALERAVAAGLADPRAALADAAFDPVREQAEFRKLAARFQAPAAPDRRAPSEVIRAGDVEISVDDDGERIVAGDLTLDVEP